MLKAFWPAFRGMKMRRQASEWSGLRSDTMVWSCFFGLNNRNGYWKCHVKSIKVRILRTAHEQISVSWPAVVEKGPISSGYLGWLSAGEESTTLDGSFMFSCRTSKWNPSILEPVNVITCWFHLLEIMRSCHFGIRSLAGDLFRIWQSLRKGHGLRCAQTSSNPFPLLSTPPNHGLVGGV